MSKNKQLILGLGEVGYPLLTLLSKNVLACGYDINPELMKKKKFERLKRIETSFTHVCFPFTQSFIKKAVKIFKEYHPKAMVIHSTVQPYTTHKLQKILPIPVIYSPVRGIHKRMHLDLKRYTKFYALDNSIPNSHLASYNFSKIMKKCGIRTKKISNPLTLELAKIICDTSYYGWLINYAQLSNVIARQHGVDYNEMWSFADEIHKFLGNRPKMYPGYIGGHCVIPNLDLIHNKTLNLIKELNEKYLKEIPEAKKISKKYQRGKKSYNTNN